MTGTELRQRRKRLGLTQYELADELGFSQPTIVRWEREERPLREALIDKLLTILEHERAVPDNPYIRRKEVRA